MVTVDKAVVSVLCVCDCTCDRHHMASNTGREQEQNEMLPMQWQVKRASVNYHLPHVSNQCV